MFFRPAILVIILALFPAETFAVEIETDPALNGAWSIGRWDTIVFTNGNFSRDKSKGAFTAGNGVITLTVTLVLSGNGAEWITKAKYIAAGNTAESANMAFRTIRGFYKITADGKDLTITWEDGGVFTAKRK